jgi:hypothetical protein
MNSLVLYGQWNSELLLIGIKKIAIVLCMTFLYRPYLTYCLDVQFDKIVENKYRKIVFNSKIQATTLIHLTSGIYKIKVYQKETKFGIE